LAQGSGEAVESARKAQATEAQQDLAGYLGTIPGATDLVDQLLPRFGSTGRLAAFIGKVGARAIKGVFAEGLQEGFQQWLYNLIARGVYKPDQDIWEDVPKSALVGALVGGGVSAVIGRGEDLREPPVTPSDAGTAYAAMRGGGPIRPEPGPVPPPEQLNLPLDPSGPPNPPPAEAPPSVVTPPPPGEPTFRMTPPPLPPTEPTAPTTGLPVQVPMTGGTVFTEGPPPAGTTVGDFIREPIRDITQPELTIPTSEELLAPARQDVQSKPGVDAARLRLRSR
jgi:hypothetical protein